jgi:mono/diheme cytochrome c family protein
MRILYALALGSILLLSSVARPQEAQPRAIQEDHPGYPLYRQYCASCHGVFADGLGPVVPFLRSRPPICRVSRRNTAVRSRSMR